MSRIMKNYWVLDEILNLPKGYVMTSAEHGLLVHNGKGYWYKYESEEGKEIMEEVREEDGNR